MSSPSNESPPAHGGGLPKLLEPLAPDDLEAIHAQAMRILTEVGTEVHDESMRDRLAAAGQTVEETRVRWDPDFVWRSLPWSQRHSRCVGATMTGR